MKRESEEAAVTKKDSGEGLEKPLVKEEAEPETPLPEGSKQRGRPAKDAKPEYNIWSVLDETSNSFQYLAVLLVRYCW